MFLMLFVNFPLVKCSIKLTIKINLIPMGTALFIANQPITLMNTYINV